MDSHAAMQLFRAAAYSELVNGPLRRGVGRVAMASSAVELDERFATKRWRCHFQLPSNQTVACPFSSMSEPLTDFKSVFESTSAATVPSLPRASENRTKTIPEAAKSGATAANDSSS